MWCVIAEFQADQTGFAPLMLSRIEYSEVVAVTNMRLR